MIEFLANESKVQISDEDYGILFYIWSTNSNGYVLRQENKKKIYLHKIIAEKLMLFGLIDHKDRNKLNNQRDNLRIATCRQNSRNSKIRNPSGFKGVCFHNQTNKWQAGITVEGKFINLGLFDKIEEAAKAYDQAAKSLFKDFASLNF